MKKQIIVQEESKEPKTEKRKTGRITLTDNQEQFCKLVVQGKEPLEAMLTVYPNRGHYDIGNQRMLLRQMQKNPRITERLEVLFKELRNNEVIGDLYNFDKGVKLLTDEIEKAKEYITNGNFSEALHRIILTSVQELNRMYGFNIVDKNGNSSGSVNITFVNVRKPEGDDINGKK